MSNTLYNFTVPFAPGTTVRSDGINAQFNAVQNAFDATELSLNKKLAVNVNATVGSLTIPNVSLTNGLLYFDGSNNLTVFDKSIFDADVAQVASDKASVSIMYSDFSPKYDVFTTNYANFSTNYTTFSNDYATFNTNYLDFTPKYTDFAAKYPTFDSNYTTFATNYADFATKYPQALAAENNALASETLSQQYANHPEDVLIPNTVEYSAFHWKKKAEALAGGTAPDALKLGGQLPSYYAQKTDLNWSVTNIGRALVNGDSILFNGAVETVYTLPVAITAGHQFYLKNIGTGNIAIPASATISITDGTVTAVNGDRVIVEPNNDISLIALDATTVRIL